MNERGEVIRIVSIIKKSNIINIYNYSTYSDEVIEYDTAQFFLSPVFRIGDLSKIIDKKTDTIRKYEKAGLIPAARKINLNPEGSAAIRIYTLRDIYDVIEIFSMRNKAGRRTNFSPINQTEALRHINARFQKIKNVGT